VLPLSEQIKTGFWILARFLTKKFNFGKVNPYIPDFKRGIDHFCIHAGFLVFYLVFYLVFCVYYFYLFFFIYD
jgi:hypothetical protein